MNSLYCQSIKNYCWFLNSLSFASLLAFVFVRSTVSFVFDIIEIIYFMETFSMGKSAPWLHSTFLSLQNILYIFIATDVGFVVMQLNMKQVNDAWRTSMSD